MPLPTPSTPGYTSFRGYTCCICLAEWLPVFEQELVRRGVITATIDIAQLTGSAAASASTHSGGGAFDIWQHDDTTVWVARQMGADATWARTTGSFANNRHTHGVLTGCPHNSAAAYQIAEVRAGGDGLVGSAPDPGPRPLSGRTWQQGIAWARQQQEEDMPSIDDVVKALRPVIAEEAEKAARKVLDEPMNVNDPKGDPRFKDKTVRSVLKALAVKAGAVKSG